MENELVPDELADFLLDEVIGLERVLALPAFREHTRESCAIFLESVRRVAREKLFPAYKQMDAEAPRFEGGRVYLHPRMAGIYRQLVDLGLINATRGADVGGASLPMVVHAMANAYVMAANLGAAAILGLTTGAARLIESFGTPELRETFMARMYAGEWTGTMALTEPQAGSSLTDVATRATPAGDGTYRITGTKIFISGGEQDLTENIVHLTLARIDGAPPGIKGVSLFAVPKLRPEGGELVPNDVACTSVFHKIGWRALPSVQLAYGENGDCRGWLVGKPHAGISQMFQMMNEARVMVGLNAIASASVAYQASLAYARDRPQGRPLGAKDPTAPQVPIVAHPDVRRMLLRQKAIVEGGLGLLLRAALWTDLSEHAVDAEERRRAKLLLDLVVPVAKSFPAELGFEVNTLAIQIHGGYGYTSEYLPEAWWRDQKLNSIHEGTTGIQALDLLGRKAIAGGGEPLQLFAGEVGETCTKARAAGLAAHADALTQTVEELLATTMAAGARGLSGDVEGMLRHSTDYLTAFSIITVAWELLAQAVAASRGTRPFHRGKRAACDYWFATELPRTPAILTRIQSGERSFADVRPEEL